MTIRRFAVGDKIDRPSVANGPIDDIENAIAATAAAAATDATTKANAAQAAAIAAAATDASTKANGAQSTAISTAASDATTKANAAQTAAIAASATDATTKANAAQAAANTHADAGDTALDARVTANTSAITALQAGVTGGNVAYPLLAKDTSGATADFTRGAATAGAIKLAGTTTPIAADDLFTNTQNGKTYVLDASGTEIVVPHNLYLNSSTPAGQSNSVVANANPYTVSMTGTGSIEVRVLGALVATATAAVPATFTPVSGTANTTLVGNVTTMQLNIGTVVTPYLATTSAARFALPLSKHPVTGEMMLLIEPLRKNYLWPSQAPSTQTRSLPAGTYTLWLRGTGSVDLSGGPTGTATSAAPVQFTLGGTTSVTFTITGSVTFFQCEDGVGVTSRIDSYIGTTNRSFPKIALNLTTTLPALGAAYSIYMDLYPSSITGTSYLLSVENGTGLANYLRVTRAGTQLQVKLNTASTSIRDTPQRTPMAANQRCEFTVSVGTNQIMFSEQAVPTGQEGTILGTTWGAPTSLVFANWNGSLNAAPVYVRRMAILPTQVAPKDVAAYFTTPAQDTRAYDIFLVAGQSNAYFGIGLDSAIDVSGGRVFQYTQTGTVIAADEPLDHPVPAPGYIGSALAFARDYYLPGQPAPRNNVLLLPYAVSATGFSDNRWNPGNDLYLGAVSMLGTALKKFPNARLRGVLWMQGEADAIIPWTQAQYAVALDAMIAGFRSLFGEMPFIVGGFKPGWLAANPTYVPVSTALAATPARTYLTAYANPNTAPIIGNADTGVHYTAAEDRAFAQRWWTAWQSL